MTKCVLAQNEKIFVIVFVYDDVRSCVGTIVANLVLVFTM